MRTPPLTFTLLGIAACALAACSGATAGTPPSGTAAQTLPAALENAEGLQTVAEALKTTGLASRFRGSARYTLLAPEDAAFVSLGSAGKALFAASGHTALTALITDHLLPGRIAPREISAAIDASPGGRVTLKTLSGRPVTFARSPGNAMRAPAITVTGADGSQAVLDGDAIAGGSSMALPVTGLLEKVATAS